MIYVKKKRKFKSSRSLLKFWTKAGGICWLCGLPVPLKEATRDHKVPKSRGGSNGLFNLGLAHRACNQLRGNDLAGPDNERVLKKAHTYIPRLSTDERIQLQKADER